MVWKNLARLLDMTFSEQHFERQVNHEKDWVKSPQLIVRYRKVGGIEFFQVYCQITISTAGL